MEKDIQIIWQSLDGFLKEDEKRAFNLRLKKDELFLALYKDQLKMHENLKRIPVSKAPESLLSNVMIEYSRILNKRNTSIGFNGIRNILMIFSCIIIITALLSWFFYEPDISSAPTILNTLTDAGLNFSFDLSSVKILPYTLILFSGMALVWLDHFLKLRTPHLSRS